MCTTSKHEDCLMKYMLITLYRLLLNNCSQMVHYMRKNIELQLHQIYSGGLVAFFDEHYNVK